MKIGAEIEETVNRTEGDGPAEKDLDLPARSRFGEGRAEPLVDLFEVPLCVGKDSFAVTTKVTPDSPKKPHSKAFEA